MSSRIIGFSIVIPGIAKTDLSEARSLYEKQLSDLQNLDDSIAKLQAMVALAKTAFGLDDSNEYQFLSEHAFDMGVRLFNSGRQGPTVQHHQGFAELRDLVAFTASQPRDILEAKVQNLADDWLKVYLWLYQAEGHAKLRTVSVPPKPCIAPAVGMGMPSRRGALHTRFTVGEGKSE